MILYPVESRRRLSSEGRILPVWEAIERTQKQQATQWWLIAQADHAALAGDLAMHLACADFPRLDPDVIRAIATHDAGWAPFDQPAPPRRPQGHDGDRPLSFVDMQAASFVKAWTASIERVEQDAPIAGILVSKHFCRLAQAQGPQPRETPERRAMIRAFVERETERQARLFRRQQRTAEEIELLEDVLQFFDLLSLYLCCGSRRRAAFPQRFRDHTFVISREGELFRTEPALFAPGVSLGITARIYPDPSEASLVNIPLLII